MTRTRKAALASLILLPVLAGGFALQARSTRGGAQLLDQVLTFVALRYVDTLDAQSLYEKAARGLVKELNDPYTELFTPKQLEEFSRNTNGRYAGIGMEISKVGDYVTVNKVFPNSPAEGGGVQEGDKIMIIDTTNARPDHRAGRAVHPDDRRAHRLRPAHALLRADHRGHRQLSDGAGEEGCQGHRH